MAGPSTGRGANVSDVNNTATSGDGLTEDPPRVSSSHRSSLVKRRNVSSKTIFHDARGSDLDRGDARGEGRAASITDRPLGQLWERLNRSVSEYGRFILRQSAHGVSLSGNHLDGSLLQSPF